MLRSEEHFEWMKNVKEMQLWVMHYCSL